MKYFMLIVVVAVAAIGIAALFCTQNTIAATCAGILGGILQNPNKVLTGAPDQHTPAYPAMPTIGGLPMSFLSSVGHEFESLMVAIGKFLGLAGPSGVKVATDIMTQVAAGGTNPAQVAATAADLVEFTGAVQAAADAVKANQGQSSESVLATK